MFLSKNAVSRLLWPWPENTMQGQTLTGEQVFADEYIDTMETFPHPFLSIEPLRGPLKLKRQHQHIERVIVGAQTGLGAVIPQPDWIQSIRDSFHPGKLYWKANIRKYL
jgi:protein gp37